MSSRARPQPAGVVLHLAGHHIGELAFEDSHGFHRGLPGGDLAVVVGAALGGVAELNHGHDVQDPVDPSVPGPGQAVAHVITGGGIDRRGAVPGGEVARVREPGDVTGLNQRPGGAGRADPVQAHQGGPGRGGQLLRRLLALVNAFQVADQLGGGPARPDPAAGQGQEGPDA